MQQEADAFGWLLGMDQMVQRYTEECTWKALLGSILRVLQDVCNEKSTQYVNYRHYRRGAPLRQ